ncbi:MAG: hypothetical protein ACYC1Z_02420 [Georgenia sp.]
MSRALDLTLPAVLGAAATTVAGAALEDRPPGGRVRWDRSNYTGRPVSLLGGAAVGAASALAPLCLAGTRWPSAGATGHPPRPGAATPGRAAAAAALAAGAAALAGLVDDLDDDPEQRSTKGLRGHLGALRQGRLTTGALKIAGIGAGALLAAAVLTPRQGRPLLRALDTATGAALVAGTANLHNLFDLRPGRALKVATAVAAPLALGGAGTAHGTVAATALGVAGAALPDDLAERSMLGDTGSNAVGALVGVALAAHPSRALRTAALTTVVTLTLLSERVSFSRVIDSTPALARLDALGRRTR